MEGQQQNKIFTYIGMALMFVLMYLWMQYSAPTEQPQQTADPASNTAAAEPQNAPATAPAAPVPVGDSVVLQVNAAKFAAFAPAASGMERFDTLENALSRVIFTNRGGRIKEVWIKNHSKISADSVDNDVKSRLLLLDDEKNRFEYALPVNNAAGGVVRTGELFFTVAKAGNSLTYRAMTAAGGAFEQQYTLSPDNYQIDYKIAANNLQNTLYKNTVTLEWDNYLDRLEKNATYERTMSTVYYKVNDKSPDYCDCRKDDQDALGEQPLKWFSHSNQFFNTSLIAQDFSFKNFTGITHQFDENSSDLKLLRTVADIPLSNLQNGGANMALYSGPNEINRLKAYHVDLEDIVPFGSSVFGAINRWAIYPLFVFLLKFIGSQGVVILVLTLLVKLLVYPLTYRMVLSQSKMSALKPQIEALKKKFGDDQQQMSVETMKLYSEFGVNPLGGCFPIFLQMPVWLALYRFFPAAIEFRQASFLWANDLSSYDIITRLPFDVPGFGQHISLFTIIWVLTTLWYTWYSMKQMDNSAMQNNDQMKVMKYMQYTMPVIFMFFFNTLASGLTCYLCFSNLLNIGQTMFTKYFLIDNEKIKAKLEANRNKPKKAGGWRERFEQAMREQQRVQEERNKQSKKK